MQKNFDIDDLILLEQGLRVVLSRVIELRETVRRLPNYRGDFRSLVAFSAARKNYRIMKETGDEILRRRHSV